MKPSRTFPFKVLGERRAHAQGGRGAKTPQPSKHQSPSPNTTNRPKDGHTTPSALLSPPNWAQRASKCDVARPDKPNPSMRQPGMSRAATGHANEEDHNKNTAQE